MCCSTKTYCEWNVRYFYILINSIDIIFALPRNPPASVIGSGGATCFREPTETCTHHAALLHTLPHWTYTTGAQSYCKCFLSQHLIFELHNDWDRIEECFLVWRSVQPELEPECFMPNLSTYTVLTFCQLSPLLPGLWCNFVHEQFWVLKIGMHFTPFKNSIARLI